MKKYLLSIFVLSILTITLITLFANPSFPHTPPKLNISSPKDNVNFIAPTNGGTWFDSSTGKGGNSFDLGTDDLIKLNEIEEVKVSCNTNINLNLSSTKNIKTFKVYTINPYIDPNKNYSELKISNYNFYTPKKPGVYGYIIETFWDDSHNIRFIIKLECF